MLISVQLARGHFHFSLASHFGLKGCYLAQRYFNIVTGGAETQATKLPIGRRSTLPPEPQPTQVGHYIQLLWERRKQAITCLSKDSCWTELDNSVNLSLCANHFSSKPTVFYCR